MLAPTWLGTSRLSQGIVVWSTWRRATTRRWSFTAVGGVGAASTSRTYSWGVFVDLEGALEARRRGAFAVGLGNDRWRLGRCLGCRCDSDVAVAGDFNMGPESSADRFADISEALAAMGARAVWPRAWTPSWTPLGGRGGVSRRHIDGVRSDHRPLLLGLAGRAGRTLRFAGARAERGLRGWQPSEEKRLLSFAISEGGGAPEHVLEDLVDDRSECSGGHLDRGFDSADF